MSDFIQKDSSPYRNLQIVVGLGILTLLIWHIVPYGRFFLYPFVILSTWFHEMGHGLTALILGGTFHKLEIFSTGSGVAYWSGELFAGNLGRAFVAAAGPIAPTIFGGIFLYYSRYNNRTRLIMLLFSILLCASAVIWVRSWFGLGAIVFFAILFFLVAVFGKERLNQFCLQFVAIQAFMSLYLSLDYIFTGIGQTDAGIFYSDTYHISESLFLTYWFWGGVICIFSLAIMFFSFRLLIRPKK